MYDACFVVREPVGGSGAEEEEGAEMEGRENWMLARFLDLS